MRFGVKSAESLFLMLSPISLKNLERRKTCLIKLMDSLSTRKGHGKLLKDDFQVLVAKMGNVTDGFKIIVSKEFDCFIGDFKSWLEV